MKSDEKINDRDIVTENRMRLWTWQNPKFDITDPNTPVESKKYSKYLNCCSRLRGAANHHLKEYEKLWSVLGTDQFHWYYTDKREATNSYSRAEYKGKFLWELDVPEGQIFERICCMTWHWILRNRDACPPKIFENLFWDLSWNYHDIPIEPIFNQPWRNMTPQQLRDCLFYDCGVKQCYQVIVRHPVDASWVIKNPRKETNRWQKPLS